VLGRIDQRKGYHDLGRHPDARQVPGLVLFRFDAPLFFANSDHFERRVRAVIAGSPHRVRRLVVAAEPITDIDTSAAAMLTTLVDDLQRNDIELAFAELKGPVKDRLIQYGLYDQIGSSRFHPTIGAAVKSYIRSHQVEWANWDD
jgi:MFS superfamily sulfate permease-like transporter